MYTNTMYNVYQLTKYCTPVPVVVLGNNVQF